MSDNKKTGSGLAVRFTGLFVLFGMLLLTLFSFIEYRNETQTYKTLKLEKLLQVNQELEKMVGRDEEYAQYMYYLDQYHDELRIPADMSDFGQSYETFISAFSTEYPQEVFGRDIGVSDLSHDVLIKWLEYRYVYWHVVFSEKNEIFGIDSACAFLPDSDRGTVTYYTEARVNTGDDDALPQEICRIDSIGKSNSDDHALLWKTWEAGIRQDGFDKKVSESDIGYTCYGTVNGSTGKPVVVISTEVEIADINQDILKTTLRMAAAILVMLTFCVIMFIYLINKLYISRIADLDRLVDEYTHKKDASIVVEIEKNNKGHDEISLLSERLATLILEVKSHIQSMAETTKELKESRKRSVEMQELSIKDPLTGIRNKTAYDTEIEQLEREMSRGFLEFGIAIVDLNYLKKINETYGHAKGNIALKKLCGVICRVFEHSPVFRIGGDEFAIVLKGHDYEYVTELMDLFKREMSQFEQDLTLDPWERISAAIGFSRFNPVIDINADNVFRRANKDMERVKAEMKAVRED